MNADLPYTGLRVLDLTQGVAGPHCGMLLAQHGADVIKVEPPEGEWARFAGRRYGGDRTAHSLAVNRGKRAIALDLKQPRGVSLARQLARRADIFLESFRPGVIDRLGLGYDAVAADNPRILYLSISGYGQSGPYAARPGTDTIMQGFTGFMSINRGNDGIPHRFGMAAIDVITSLYAFQCLAPAIQARAAGGPGRRFDISLMHAAAAFQAFKLVEFQLQKGKPEALHAPQGTFATADGYINIVVLRRQPFAPFCAAIDRPELAHDPRFAGADERVANEPALNAEIAPILRGRTSAEWVERLSQAGVLCAHVHDHGELMQDEQIVATGTVSWDQEPGVGPIPVVPVPGAPPLGPDDARRRSPRLGQHTRDILAELGLAAAEIEGLIGEGVAFQPAPD